MAAAKSNIRMAVEIHTFPNLVNFGASVDLRNTGKIDAINMNPMQQKILNIR